MSGDRHPDDWAGLLRQAAGLGDPDVGMVICSGCGCDVPAEVVHDDHEPGCPRRAAGEHAPPATVAELVGALDADCHCALPCCPSCCTSCNKPPG